MSASPDGRPTFGTYWRKNKEDSPSRGLIFVQSDPSQSNSKVSERTEESAQTAKNKRRAQVRKAQMQHRARKANYTKQLEADIEAIRAQIEGTDRARHALRSENQALRTQLASEQQQQQQQQHRHHQQSQHHQHHHQQFTTAAPDRFYPAPMPYPQEADAMGLHQQSSSYGGFDVGGAGLDGAYFAGLGADLSEFLGSVAGTTYYDSGGSPAYASSSRGSSGGMYGSRPCLDSGSSTPCLGPGMGSHGQANQHQVMDHVPGFY